LKSWETVLDQLHAQAFLGLLDKRSLLAILKRLRAIASEIATNDFSSLVDAPHEEAGL
jgi:hypothetical protein